VWSCSMRQRPRRACCQSFTQCHSCNKCNSPVILPCARETRKRLADQARLRACRPGLAGAVRRGRHPGSGRRAALSPGPGRGIAAVSAHFLSHPGAAMLRVVGVGDGKAATRLKVADPEVPGRVGTSLWSFPGTTPMQAAGRVRAPVTEVCVRPAPRTHSRRCGAGARSACGSSPADVKLRVSAERER
jgi:hypothetical protein